jgi:hypothetical protein
MGWWGSMYAAIIVCYLLVVLNFAIQICGWMSTVGIVLLISDY